MFKKYADTKRTSPAIPVVAKINKKLESVPAPEFPPKRPGSKKPKSF